MLSAQELFCLMAILTPIIMPKKIHFNTLVRHIAGGDREETGRRQETQNRPLSPPEPSLLILHSVVCGFAVKLQGLNAVSVVQEPGNEVFHSLDGIFLCVVAQDDTGVLIGESRDDIGDDHVHITL